MQNIPAMTGDKWLQTYTVDRWEATNSWLELLFWCVMVIWTIWFKKEKKKGLHISNSGFWIVTNLPFWQVRNSYKMLRNSYKMLRNSYKKLSYKLTTDVVKTKQNNQKVMFWLGKKKKKKNPKKIKQLSSYLIKTKHSLKALCTSGFYTFGVCASKSSSKW